MVCKPHRCARFRFKPDLKDEALVEAIAKEKPDVLVVRGTKVTEAMLAAGQSSWSCAPAPATTRSTSPPRRDADLCFELSGKELDRRGRTGFRLILALDRRIADNVIALRAASGTRRSFPKRVVCMVARWA